MGQRHVDHVQARLSADGGDALGEHAGLAAHALFLVALLPPPGVLLEREVGGAIVLVVVTVGLGVGLGVGVGVGVVGAVDVAIGALVDRLRARSTWDDTLLVVTSDHGYSLTPPDLGRAVTDGNAEEVYRVPLFIKAPGQIEGEVVDATAQTIDVLPSIIDLLDAEVGWELDGHSLYDGSRPHTPPRVDPDVDAVLAIAARRAEQFPYGDDWVALAAVGANGDLVGRDVDELTVGVASEYGVIVDQAEQLDRQPADGGTLPPVLTGTVTGPAAPPSAELVVAVDGTVAGVVGDYRREGRGWAFTGYIADLSRDGVNELVVYEVERAPGGAILHPAN